MMKLTRTAIVLALILGLPALVVVDQAIVAEVYVETEAVPLLTANLTPESAFSDATIIVIQGIVEDTGMLIWAEETPDKNLDVELVGNITALPYSEEVVAVVMPTSKEWTSGDITPHRQYSSSSGLMDVSLYSQDLGISEKGMEAYFWQGELGKFALATVNDTGQRQGKFIMARETQNSRQQASLGVEASWMPASGFMAGQIDRTLYRKGMVELGERMKASDEWSAFARPSPTSVVTDVSLLMLSASTVLEDLDACTTDAAKTTVDAVIFLG